MSRADGSLIFDTKVDTQGFNSGTKQISNGVSGLKSSVLKLGAAIGIAFSVTKIISFGKQCVETASDLAEVQNVVDTAFGSLSKEMDQFADKAVETYGISKLTAKQTGSTYMAMASGMGIAKKTASDMSLSLTGLSADMASFYNVEQSVASTALKSIFTGETETLKQFGVVMTEANLKAYALSQGITKDISAMSQAEKVQLRYGFVMKQTALAQGDFAKTSDGWANQTRVLSEKWKEFSATIGQVLIQVVLPVVKAINKALSSLISYAQKAASSLAELFGWDISSGTSGTAQMATDTAEIDSSISSATDNQNDLTKAVKDTNKELNNSLASYDELNVMSSSSDADIDTDTSSSTAADVPSTAGTEIGSTIADNVEKSTNKGLSNVFRELYVVSGLKAFIDNLQKGINKIDWSSIGNNCVSIMKDAAPIAQSYINGVAEAGQSAFGALGSAVGGYVSVCGKQFQTLSGGISKWLDKDGEKISKFFDDYFNNISTGFNNLSSFFDGWFGLMGESVDRMRPTMETAISGLLSGFSDFGMSVGTIVSEGFEIATNSLNEWIESDGATIGEFFDNIQLQVSDTMTFIGGVFSDIGETLSSWWNGDGSGIFQEICDMFTNIGTTLMNVYNKWIMPVWNYIVDLFQSAWDNCLQPLFSKAISLFGKLWDCISTLWNNILSPLINWIVDTFGPGFSNVFNAIKGVFDTVFTFIGDVVGGLWDSLGGLLDFITGVFSGDWEKAWSGICDFFGGIWDAIWGIIKGVINLIIDGINLLWTGIYMAVSGIVNAIGSVAGALGDLFGQDWSFSMPSEPPLIPKLATGTVVPANYGEYMAILGDNKREPEVVSPLSTMKQALAEVMAEVGGGQGGGDINITIELDGDVLARKTVKWNDNYKKTHGKTAFA